MKKIISFLYIFIMLTSCNLPYVTAANIDNLSSWPQGPDVYAEAAIVMEASTGLILYGKNIDKAYYPASITKILTALLVIENSSPGEIVTFSHDSIFNVDRKSSLIGIDVGEQLTMQQCLYAILLMSANEVTYAVAEHVAGDIPTFANMMNERAKAIGCKNSNFVNPHGLPDDNHYTTAYDMALITREAMKNETFRKITGTRTSQIPATNKTDEIRYLRNHHKFILKQDYTYDGAIGGKTGFTSKARFTLVTIAKRGDLELISVILKVDTSDNQYRDTTKLLDFGFDNFSIYPINELESPNRVKESPFFTRYNSILDYTNSFIKTDEKGYLVLPNTASFKDAKKEVSFYPEVEIKEGRNAIGRISYTYDDMYVGGAYILYDNVETPTLTHTQLNKTPSNEFTKETESKTSDGYFRPIIIGLIVGGFVLIIGLYFVLVERPRLKRRSNYLKKRANRRRNYSDDDYLDL
ncbi:MAG: D-alanyl-D-alanine carboxypeptidase [Clostridiales bacterium]|nr:D-alanyl-D-alanine carboxypeptidase [Clostridiales bacterium]